MRRVYLNIDVNSTTLPFLNKIAEQETVSKEMLYPYVDIYRETEVTDILFNTFAQSSVSESVYWDSYADIYERKEENGIAVDYTSTVENNWPGTLYGVHRINREFGIDPWQVWVARARENGMRAWISLRMNDAHCFKLETFYLRSLYHYEARSRGMTLGEDYLYYKGCYNYEYEEIREKMLGYIDEQLSRYDADGLELDFSREIQLFKYLTADMDKCRAIMTEFVGRVKKTVEKYEAIRGHRILLGIKCMRDFVNNSFYGLDILKIAELGFVDTVFTGPRFRSSETGVPIDEWRCAMPKVDIVPVLETSLGVVEGKYRDMTREIAKGVLANYLTYDPSGIYYYNYFIGPRYYTDGFSRDTWSSDTTLEWTRNLNLLTTKPEFSEIHKGAVRFVLIPQLKEGYAALAPVWQPIPALLDSKEKCFEIRTGPIPKGKKLSLILGFRDYTEGVRVHINGNECPPLAETSIDFIEGMGYQSAGYLETGVKTYRCSVDPTFISDSIQSVAVRSELACETLSWIELDCY